ncbi:MAG: MFS transporter [Paenibacillaceae bacterium]|uniref:MFS transporter n=1 Tax=Paenibacillus mellifer TaxID=2937794 RepID=A0A9X1Y038_9BACL|nr:MFS transporter [Paenibacillus mellifer]MBW4838131.1 MFS transporter [Paenibacillaceae bacterium]MCK8488442.1 MFS transporter [Paenibacillus mellifer]
MKRSFFWLWSSQTLSNMADVLYIVAFITLVLDQTGSIVFATLVPFIRVSSQLISSLLAPLVLAKFPLTTVLSLSQGGQFLLFALLASYVSPWVGGTMPSILYGMILILSFLDGWTTPARNALVPRLVHDQVLLKANGMMATTDQIVQFAGWALSGVVVAKFGSFPVLAAVAGAYGFAMLATTRIMDPTEQVTRSAEAGNGSGELMSTQTTSRWETLKEGWITLWRLPRLQALTWMELTDLLGGAVWSGAFLLVFVRDILHRDESWWGYINAGYFAGAVLGGLLIVVLVNKLERRLFHALWIGTLGYAALTIAFALNTAAILTLVLVLLTGPFAELAGVARQTFTQRGTDPQMLPKVLSARAALQNFLFGISLLLMSFVAEGLGIVYVYLLAGGFSVLSAMIGVRYRRVLNRTTQNGSRWYN